MEENRSAPSGNQSLKAGSLGPVHIVLLVLAAAAPLGAMIGSAPVAIALGNGGGVAGTYLIAAVILACFAAGYATMSKKVRNAGAFYAYISKGLGKPAGTAAAYAAVISYNAVAIGVVIVLGVFAQTIFAEQFGINWQWYVWTGIAIPLIGYLAHNKIDFSVRVLSVALFIEVVILLVMNFAVIFSEGLDLNAFSPSTVFSSGFGIGLLFCFLSFVGFEGTAIYAEEAKDPRRTVPRATYWAIAVIGIFYAVTSWVVISFYGVDSVKEVANGDPTGFIFNVAGSAVGSGWSDLMQIFLVTSLFASYLGIHNSAARYNFALGRQKLLPSRWGDVHHKHGSPWIGNIVCVIAAGVTALVTAFLGGDPYLKVGAIVLAIGTIGVVALQAATAAAVTVYYWRERGAGEQVNPLTSIALPGIGAVALAIATYLGVHNFALLTGVESGWQNDLPWMLVIAAVIGAGYALWLKSNRPGIYAAIGESVDDGDEPPPTRDVVVGRDPEQELSSF